VRVVVSLVVASWAAVLLLVYGIAVLFGVAP
jgi:hypothetical protein